MKGGGVGMDSETERLLARIITERSALLDQRASTDGVLSFLRRPPPPRGRPNERFLQSTLMSVFHSNRREQESRMWEQRDAQLSRQEGGQRDKQKQHKQVGDG